MAQQETESASADKAADKTREELARVLALDPVAQWITAEFYRDLTAQGIDNMERDDPAFFSCVVQTLFQTDKTKRTGTATTKLSLSREEQQDLFRRFSADHLGLAGFELGAAMRNGEWRERYLSWLEHQDLKVRGRRGAPRKDQPEATRAYYEVMGKPRLTTEVCDALAQSTYPSEFSSTKPYSEERKKLRDRVRRQVRPLLNTK